MTKTERKSEYSKLKKTFKDVWTTEMETDEDCNSDKMDVPSHYKKYTIQDRKIIVQQPMRELKEPGTSYDGPEKAKKIDLAEPGEEPKPTYIATDLTEEEEQLLISTLKQYRDVFAWSYKDLKDSYAFLVCSYFFAYNVDETQMIWYCDSGASRHIISRKDLFCSLDAAPAEKKVTCANNASYPIKGVETKTQAMQDAELWHARFGHVGYGSLMTLQCHNMVHDLSLLKMPPRHVCEGCVLGKMHKFAFLHDGFVRATRKLQLVHSNVCGPMRTPSVGNSLYFVTFIDDFSRFCWVYPLKAKSDVFAIFQHYVAIFENETGCKVQTLRTDRRGGEYMSGAFEDFLGKKDIKHQCTMPYTPQQNGVAKSKNRCPTRVLKNITPYEAWYDKKPSANYLRVFGCLAYAHIPQQLHGKLDVKAVKCIFVGKDKQGLRPLKKIQIEKQRIAAGKKAKEVNISSQSTQEPKEKEVVDITSHMEPLERIQRDKKIEEQRAAALAREKIKEILKRTAEQAVLEPRGEDPKRQEHKKDEDKLENIQLDPTPSSPKSSAPRSPAPPTSPPSPKSPHAPTSPKKA
ncbi:hypothetical protein L7F22_057231 [Adiantum nelumboides]|nr:hypothetical protein [Adiantum nelumboides]